MLRADRGRVAVVGGGGVERIGMTDGRGVARGVGTGDGGGDDQSLGSAWVDGADRPETGGIVVGTLAGVSGDEADAGREYVLHGDVGGRVGAVVDHRDRVGNGIAHVRRRIADPLVQLQVGLLRRLRGGSAVVAGIGI